MKEKKLNERENDEGENEKIMKEKRDKNFHLPFSSKIIKDTILSLIESPCSCANY